MPCSIYKGAQQRLCFATNEWKNFSKLKSKKIKLNKKIKIIKKNERRRK